MNKTRTIPTRKIRLASVNDLDQWRAAARALLLAGVPPEEVSWDDPAVPQDLFGASELPPPAVTGRKVGVVPERFLALAAAAICHSDPGRFALLYSLLWRLQKDRTILSNRDDPDVGKLHRRVEAVMAEQKRMRAELRFRRAVTADGHKGLAAWFAPRHYVLERVAPHFTREYRREAWVIATPCRSAYWDRHSLSFGPGGRRPGGSYDETTSNRSEAQIIAPREGHAEPMETEMEMRTESQTPIRQARRTAREEIEPQAEEIVSLADARAAVEDCRRCPLYEFATQAVFGEGPARAEIMFVGEQPGDQEDVHGRPFVGPAGKVFDKALEKVGIERKSVYVTNAVKHFKFQQRGKKRMHQRPNSGEIQACRFWLDLEREFVKPKVIVALGATAAQSLLGRTATISSLRGTPVTLEDGTLLYVTIHPSYLLRLRIGGDVATEQEEFETELAAIRDLAAAAGTRRKAADGKRDA
jgi:probable DNA metabolism protein